MAWRTVNHADLGRLSFESPLWGGHRACLAFLVGLLLHFWRRCSITVPACDAVSARDLAIAARHRPFRPLSKGPLRVLLAMETGCKISLIGEIWPPNEFEITWFGRQNIKVRRLSSNPAKRPLQSAACISAPASNAGSGPRTHPSPDPLASPLWLLSTQSERPELTQSVHDADRVRGSRNWVGERTFYGFTHTATWWGGRRVQFKVYSWRTASWWFSPEHPRSAGSDALSRSPQSRMLSRTGASDWPNSVNSYSPSGELREKRFS